MTTQTRPRTQATKYRTNTAVLLAQAGCVAAALIALLALSFTRISTFGFTAISFTALRMLMDNTLLMLIPLLTTAAMLVFLMDGLRPYSWISAIANAVVLSVFVSLSRYLLVQGDIKTLLTLASSILPADVTRSTLSSVLGGVLKPGAGFVVALLATIAYGVLSFFVRTKIRPVTGYGPSIKVPPQRNHHRRP